MNIFSSRYFAFALLTLSATTTFVTAAPAAKKAVKKPAPKPQPQPKLIREVMGNEQLVGYEGALGQTFTIGKESAINFTLRKAAYTVGRVNIGQYSHFTNGEEKLLVLHFTLHNPHKKPFNYTASCLNFKAVDASGVTREAITDTAREVTGQLIDSTLQLGQKIEVYRAIRVSAFGEVPKLIVQNHFDLKAPIVRYDLRGKVARLGAPYADSADAKGATARKMIPAKIGVAYPMTDAFDVRIDKVSYSGEALNGSAPNAGKRHCVALATIKNLSPKPVTYGASYFNADLRDADGEKVLYNARPRKASRDEESSGSLAPGEEARLRFYWELPANVDAKTVLLRYGYDKEARVYAVEAKG